jgi:hypothetical protein
MTTDLDRASDPATPPNDLADILTRWKSSRHSRWAIVHALARNAALPEKCLLDLAWSCQADAVFNSATFLQLFADPGLGDRLVGAICRPGPKDERPRDPELFQGFCRWLAEGTDVPGWLAEAVFHQHVLRHALTQGNAPHPLVTPRARMAFEAICRNPNVTLPDPSPKDETHRTQLMMLLSGITDIHAAYLPGVEAATRTRFFEHPLWKRIDGATALALDAGRPDIGDPLPGYLSDAWPTFAVTQGWTDVFRFPASWSLKRRLNFAEGHRKALERKDPVFDPEIYALAEEAGRAKTALAQPKAQADRAALRATARGREIRRACLFAITPSIDRIAVLLAEAKETNDEEFAHVLFIASREFLDMGVNPKRLAEKDWPRLRAVWTRLEEPRVAQLEATMDTCVRIGIELHRIVSAEGRQDAIDWEKDESGDRSHAVFRIDAEGPNGFSWDVNADDPKLLAVLKCLSPGCAVSALRKALAPFATEA